jgi:hypothetical protein
MDDLDKYRAIILVQQELLNKKEQYESFHLRMKQWHLGVRHHIGPGNIEIYVRLGGKLFGFGIDIPIHVFLDRICIDIENDAFILLSHEQMDHITHLLSITCTETTVDLYIQPVIRLIYCPGNNSHEDGFAVAIMSHNQSLIYPGTLRLSVKECLDFLNELRTCVNQGNIEIKFKYKQ